MFSQIFTTIGALSVLATNTFMAGTVHIQFQPEPQAIATKDYSLADRYHDSFVNSVFDDNILLTLAYLRGVAKDGQEIHWDTVREDFTYIMVLKPGETFAFHDQVLPEYTGKVTLTTNAHFTSDEGFRSDGWLVADGVCHLASFMNMVAQKAGLKVVAPTPHDFAAIADVPKEYGTAIFYMPNEPGSSALQNLYITNTQDFPIGFVFTHKGKSLDITIEKMN